MMLKNKKYYSGIIAYPSQSEQLLTDVYNYKFWELAARICKPGSFLFCFGTRAHHRVACAIEDAGWQIKDSISWFNSKAHEPIIVAMKPLEKGLTYAQNAKKWNVAGLNIDAARIRNHKIER